MAAKHDYELSADPFTHLHLDHRHMGVGGDDSWSPSLHKVLVQMLQRCAEGCCFPLLLVATFICTGVASIKIVILDCPVQEYAVEPGEYKFSVLLAPVLPNKEVTAPETAASLWRQQVIDHFS